MLFPTVVLDLVQISLQCVDGKARTFRVHARCFPRCVGSADGSRQAEVSLGECEGAGVHVTCPAGLPEPSSFAAPPRPAAALHSRLCTAPSVESCPVTATCGALTGFCFFWVLWPLRKPCVFQPEDVPVLSHGRAACSHRRHIPALECEGGRSVHLEDGGVRPDCTWVAFYSALPPKALTGHPREPSCCSMQHLDPGLRQQIESICLNSSTERGPAEAYWCC